MCFSLPVVDVECSADPCLCAHLRHHHISACGTLQNQDHVSGGPVLWETAVFIVDVDV